MKAHAAIVGMTMSGKTFLARSLASEFQKAGVGVIVYDPLGQKQDWPCNRFTRKPEQLLAWARKAQGCAIFIEEASTVVTGKRNCEFNWLATQARHRGHRCFFLAQRGTQLPPIIRENCGEAYLFRMAERSAEVWAEDFCEDGIMRATSLEKYQFVKIERYKKPVISKLRK